MTSGGTSGKCCRELRGAGGRDRDSVSERACHQRSSVRGSPQQAARQQGTPPPLKLTLCAFAMDRGRTWRIPAAWAAWSFSNTPASTRDLPPAPWIWLWGVQCGAVWAGVGLCGRAGRAATICDILPRSGGSGLLWTEVWCCVGMWGGTGLICSDLGLVWTVTQASQDGHCPLSQEPLK